MATTTANLDPTVTDSPRAESPALWRLRVDQYHAMARAGIIEDGAPIELLEGLLVAKVTKSPPHELIMHVLPSALEALVPSGWSVRREAPITLSDSEPEPDVAIVAGEPQRFGARHPGPDEVALVVEIAGASLQSDQTLKLRVYARAGIPSYWIVNLRERRVEAFAKPGEVDGVPGYAARQVFGEDTSVPVVVGGREVGHITVRDILP